MVTPLRFSSATQPSARTDRARPSGAARATFAGSAGQAPSGIAGAAPVQAVTSLDALMALQAVDDPATRRHRAARRGGALLDQLDALKLANLEGRAGRPELDRIGGLVASAREATDDEGLELVIDAIELRAQVEIAKRRR